MKNLVFGASGLVGRALVKKLHSDPNQDVHFATSRTTDLLSPSAIDTLLEHYKPDRIYMAAGLVGGLKDNAARPAEYLYNNMQMGFNVVHSAYKHGVNKLLYFSSSCAYPKDINQPMSEDVLMTGKLEETNEGYALAKIATQKLCEFYNKQYGTNFITAIPCNLYGNDDKFDLDKGHFVGSLITKFCRAVMDGVKEVEVWGDGFARREIMHVDDLADASIFLMDNYNDSDPINVGIGSDWSIRDVTMMIAKVSGFEGLIRFNSSKPSGVKQKLLDVTKLTNLGWKATIRLEDGLRRTASWYFDSHMVLDGAQNPHG